MNELTIWCACGWTKKGFNVTLSWLRLLIHELRRHRKDLLWGQGGVNRYRIIPKVRGNDSSGF